MFARERRRRRLGGSHSQRNEVRWERALCDDRQRWNTTPPILDTTPLLLDTTPRYWTQPTCFWTQLPPLLDTTPPILDTTPPLLDTTSAALGQMPGSPGDIIAGRTTARKTKLVSKILSAAPGHRGVVSKAAAVVSKPPPGCVQNGARLLDTTCPF